jgi:hypothetical protein
VIEEGLLDDDLRPIDRLGRRQPRRTNALMWFKAIPGFAVQFKRIVPESYFTAKPKGRCEVRCPCGTTQEFDMGDIHECEGNCGRFYLWSSRTLRVANPTREEVTPTS